MQDLKIGIIVDELSVKFPYSQIIKNLMNSGVGIDLVIYQKIEHRKASTYSDLLFRGVRKLESFFFPKLKERFNFASEKIPILRVFPNISPSGFVYRYSDTDLEKIRDYKLDVIVRAGSGILRGGILSHASRLGIFSLHHGDPQRYRGGPPGFWEIIGRRRESGFMIQKLTADLDGGEVLYQDAILTSRVYSKNLLNLYAASVDPFVSVLKSNSHLYGSQKDVSVYSARLYTNPGVFDTLRYIYSVICYALQRTAGILFKRDWQWMIHYFTSSLDRAELRRGKILIPPRDRFYADPFPVERGGSSYIYFEELKYSARIGTISCYDVRNDRYYRDVVRENFHLSFPVIFEFNNIMFMTVESSQNKDLRLYECLEFPDKWRLRTQLLRDAILLDPIVVKDQDQCYVIANSKKTSESAAFDLKVYALRYVAPHFKLIPLDVVNSHHKGSRNGGYLYTGTRHIRVIQNADFDTYGKSISLLEFNITGNQYSEKFVDHIDDLPVQGAKGIHTLNNAANFIVFDSVRRTNVRC